jgi:EAL domain-containing protein (putative c-di-GMP-specific phosphodiesterase class I)/cellulose synthase/poly-beta-1,6-N-acetylglucosamine synthase-like glycosyltransferase
MQSTTDATRPTRRRQWGSDRRERPLPMVPAPVSERRIRMGRLAIVLTVSAWFSYLCLSIFQQFIEGRADSARLVVEAIVYMLVVTALTASAMAYLITRIGFFYRSRGHRRAPRAAIDDFFDGAVPSVTVIVPSYQEDERVVRTTLLSAALQEQPNLRVVLLVDDPPEPTTAHAAELLDQARSLPGRIEELLSEPRDRFTEAFDAFEQAQQAGGAPPSVEDLHELAEHYRVAVRWLRDLADAQEIVDHSDEFFAEYVIGALADDLEVIGMAVDAAANEGATLPVRRVRQLHRRLVSTFTAELTSFERKQYVSLSHAPNKAMNLNSYIGLMGGSYREVATPLGTALVACAPRSADLTVPEPDYVLTLDADSVLLPEYTARILHLMEQSAHAKVAVAQTPYSSYPGAATRIERISGATTDLQHIVHQGMTHYDATFWVGANAILRKPALEDICEIEYVGDWEVRRYIQDRTVIEDTESTIDLGVHGWTLFNYPERLAYSATPPDYGSLCIQRQRWANGGLLILSKLRRQSKARKARGEQNRFGEVFLRVNYMASIFWASICLLIMLCYPFNSGLLNPILLLIALPYFFMMAGDLHYLGYKRTDVFRIYGFNLILLAVNLSGSFASMLQLITGEKSAFKRTPKVSDRTTARAIYVLAPFALVALSVYTIVLDLTLHRWENLVYAVLNASLAFYAIVAFVGLGNCVVDLWLALRGWLYRPVPAKPVERPVAATTSADGADAVRELAVADWASVLYYGTTDAAETAVIAKRPTTAAATASTETSPAGTRGVPLVPTPPARSSLPKRKPGTAALSGVESSHSFEGIDFFTVFQPIRELDSDEAVGFEALTRFADGRSPDAVLAEAQAQDRAGELDAALVRAALDAASELPEGVWVSINVSPALAERPDLLIADLATSRRPVVVEFVADTREDPSGWIAALPPHVSVAVDDAGAGYDSLALVEALRPAYMKLDRTTVTGIEIDAARQAFVGTLVGFAEEHGCQVIAEGVETLGERQALVDAGVHLGQGYLLGRPMPVERTHDAQHASGTAVAAT